MVEADVAVLGCGLMGSALARALARAGREVVVWNRSFGKATALQGVGITAVESVHAAVSTAPLIITCLNTYDTVVATLDDVAWPPRGKTLLNLSTGTPPQAEALDRWAADRSVLFLDGAILAYPADIGEPHCQLLISGPTRVWTQNRDVIMDLGGSTKHITETIVGANVMDVGVIGAFYISALTAFIESAAYVTDYGISTESLLEVSKPVLRLLDDTVAQAVSAIGEQDYRTDQATLSVYSEAIRTFSAEISNRGNRSFMVAAAAASLSAAEEAGLGALGIFSVHQIARR